MKDSKTKKIIAITLFIIAILLIAGLLALSIVNYFNQQDGQPPLVRSETMYVLIIFLLLLPVFLVILIIASFTKKETKPIDIVLDGQNPIQVQGGFVAEGVASSKKKDKEQGETPRFCMLTQIDANSLSYQRENYDKAISMKKLCDTFHLYAANKLHLYYEIDDIRRFIAGLSVSHIIILQGMSGTGKTSLAHAFGDFLENQSTVIPVQPMWKERTDLIGYYNEFTQRFNETKLLEKMYEANYSKDMYVTVLDEMNIARVEYYFAEFLSLLELPNPDERYLDVVSDKWDNDPASLVNGRIKLPPNMWFIGTANNDDSTFAISDKVYDRAMVLNLDTKAEPFIAPKTKNLHVSAEQFEKLTHEAIEEYAITSRNMRRLEKLDAYLIENFHMTFGNRIMKQIKTYIPVYVACGGNELEALDDILSKKVIRKLEAQNPVYLRNSADKLCAYLDELFGVDRMPICKNHIKTLARNA